MLHEYRVQTGCIDRGLKSLCFTNGNNGMDLFGSKRIYVAADQNSGEASICDFYLVHQYSGPALPLPRLYESSTLQPIIWTSLHLYYSKCLTVPDQSALLGEEKDVSVL